jgi:hypothetical protein
MGYVKEPDGIDFEFINRPLTLKEKDAFSDFLRKKKELKAKRIIRIKAATKKHYA